MFRQAPEMPVGSGLLSAAETGGEPVVTVLLVDDSPQVRTGLRMQLGLQPGSVEVVEAGTAEEALDLVEELRPEIVVMDVGLPGLDGIEATQRLGAIDPGCVVMILTIHDDAATRSRAMSAGARTFLAKGKADSLRKELQSLLGPAGPWS